jgi:hypothetical protein
MRVTRDYIPEGQEDAWLAQMNGKKSFMDWMPPTAEEAIQAERAAIASAVEQGLRPKEHLDDWDRKHGMLLPEESKRVLAGMATTSLAPGAGGATTSVDGGVVAPGKKPRKPRAPRQALVEEPPATPEAAAAQLLAAGHSADPWAESAGGYREEEDG